MSQWTEKRTASITDAALIELYPADDQRQRNRDRWITREAMRRAHEYRGFYSRPGFAGKVVQVTSDRETPWVNQ